MNKVMMTTAMALVLGAGAIAIGVFAPSQARAEAAEFFKCTMAEDGSMEALVAIANDTEAMVAAWGIENYSVAYLTPLYSSDLAEGTFYWVGVADSYADAGAVNEIWESSVGDAIRARWDAQINGCEASSLWRLTRTPNEGDDD